jgi:hypothetical protein
VFIDALAAFVTQMNAFGAQLVQATQERVVNEAAGSFAGAAAARDAAIAARDAAQAFAASIDPATLVKLTGNQSIAGTKNFTGVLQLTGKALTLAATYAEASTADVRANIAERLLSVRSLWNALVPVALDDAATIALDLNTGIHFTVPLAGNRTLAAPTNGKPGQEGFIRVAQDATGGRTLSFAAAYKFPDLTTAPSLNAGAGTVTLLRYHVSATGEVFLSGGKPGISGGLRQQTVNIVGGYNGYYYAAEAQTVDVVFTTLNGTTNSGGSGSITKNSAANTVNFATQIASNVQNGTVVSGIAMEAGTTLSLNNSGNGWAHVIRRT